VSSLVLSVSCRMSGVCVSDVCLVLSSLSTDCCLGVCVVSWLVCVWCLTGVCVECDVCLVLCRLPSPSAVLVSCDHTTRKTTAVCLVPLLSWCRSSD